MIVIAALGRFLIGALLTLMAIFLILLVLVQRGRGGGLAGALGGMGGSSAFGAKAGDVFTRITIVAASIWILLCIAASRFGTSYDSRISNPRSGNSSSTAAADVDAQPGEDASAVEQESAATSTATEAAVDGDAADKSSDE